ncbi:UPF0481 protein At3g47200-like [Humulus lupulus]|uniref:UPF0481 protein At3g47200-like n=1 Tax=Humulus lupulus TaxID=3486 RepID=UPI002B404C3D|nr:UPF0481 protein At3g47200-like [Humulus lupulus]XP_062105473.1 UPF0481 protein At3g47200-like [Humulus lupulus]XP_062105474.1 UPF0481 protein At3g47200-like [Humulus lupulus]XP_062105475.1 UPF0481 protein At3g47200-like [Humulus lupulus]
MVNQAGGNYRRINIDALASDVEEEDVRDYITIDVEAMATKLENMISDSVSMQPKCSPCIFRVPNMLSRQNPRAYAPNAFSIGPYHYNQPHLKATQQIKLRYLHELISRFPDTNPKSKLSELTTAISKLQKEARECYDGSIDMSMDEFIQVLVIDGCFFIEVFRKYNYGELIGIYDPIFSSNRMMILLYYDLILLENQVPWLVLDCLFKMTMTPDEKIPLITLVTNFFDNIFTRKINICEEVQKCESKHILDLLRNSLILSSCIAKQERSLNCFTDEWQVIPSATVLLKAGITFKKATRGTFSSILDIKFKDGVMEIPSLFIHPGTESMFRNLICLEQSLPRCEELITSYLRLLNYLINSSKDVQIFSEKKIIENWTDDKETVVFFNQIVNDTNLWHFYYHDLAKEVNKYCQRRWPRYRRVLIHDYFRHPWAVISIFGAAILLILTFLQTLFTIHQ